MLHRINGLPAWRRLLKEEEPDLHMKDIEILLRGFAMLDGDYKPSMSRFLNRYSRRSQGHQPELNQHFETLFTSFVDACASVPPDSFYSARTKRFSIALYEAVFAVACAKPLAHRASVTTPITEDALRRLDQDVEFQEASEKASADKSNVDKRLERARTILAAD